MAVALDTNIFIYVHFDQYPEHEKAKSFLRQLFSLPDPFYLSWQVYYEYIRIVTHPKIHRLPLTVAQAIEDMRCYLEDSRCQMLVETENHQKVVKELFKEVPKARGNFIHDCHYAALLKEHSVQEIVTADMDFKKFGFLKVINPLV